jgi:putative ABC transport system permease protein
LGILQPGASNARWSVYPVSAIDGAFLDGVGLPLVARAAGYASDAAVWRAVRSAPGAVVIDSEALSAGDAAALGVPTGYRLQTSQLIGAPIAPGIPGLSSLEALDETTQTAEDLSIAGLSLDDESLPEYQLRLRGIVTGPGTIAPTPIWVADIRGGPAIRLTVVGIVDSLGGKRAGLFGTATTFAPAERGLAPFGNEYYYFAVRAGVDPHTAAQGLGAALAAYGFETTVLNDVLLEVNGPSIFISQVLVGLVGLTLLVGMAALAVAGTRAVVERRQQIGMLRALGFRRLHIQAVFVTESLIVGSMGTAIGLVLGLVLTQNLFAVDFFERVRSGLTVTIPWGELALVCMATIAASLVAAALPAWQAGRIAPVDALRYE